MAKTDCPLPVMMVDRWLPVGTDGKPIKEVAVHLRGPEGLQSVLGVDYYTCRLAVVHKGWVHLHFQHRAEFGYLEQD